MKPVVAFDVDGTLLDERGRLREDIRTLVFLLSPHCEVIVWSGGGKEYAEHAGRMLFLPDSVTYTMKPDASVSEVDICFDDEDVKLAKVNIRV